MKRLHGRGTAFRVRGYRKVPYAAGASARHGSAFRGCEPPNQGPTRLSSDPGYPDQIYLARHASIEVSVAFKFEARPATYAYHLRSDSPMSETRIASAQPGAEVSITPVWHTAAAVCAASAPVHAISTNTNASATV